MRRRTRTRLLVTAMALVTALIALESPRAVLGEEPPAEAMGHIEVKEAMTLPAFLREVEKRIPGLFMWYENDKQVAKTTVHLGRYALDRAKLVRHLRATLFPNEIILIARGTEPEETYIVVDMRRSVKPGDPVLQPIPIDIETRKGLEHERGLYVTARISTAGLSHLDQVKRVLQVVLTQNNIGRIGLLPDGSAFEVTDFAPRVDLAHRLAKELAALQAAAK